MQKEYKHYNQIFKLDMINLAVLSQDDLYGYEITAKLEERSDGLFHLRQGVLYPILYDLVEDGYLSCSNVVVKGRNRVYYHLEDSGQKLLNELTDQFYHAIDMVNQVINGEKAEVL